MFVFVKRLGTPGGVEGSEHKCKNWIPVFTGMTKREGMPMHLGVIPAKAGIQSFL